MHRIFEKSYNLIVENFVPMCSHREQHYPSHIAALYRLRVIRAKLCSTEKQPRTKFNCIYEIKASLFLFLRHDLWSVHILEKTKIYRIHCVHTYFTIY